MKSLWVKLNLNRKLALLAGCLGFIALLAGSPYQNGKAEIDSKELALIVQKEVDHVTVNELADWIIKNRADFRLLDLRTEKEFTNYHIPNAENVDIAGLYQYGIQRNEKIVLYAEGGIHSAQAWFLLRARGFKGVYILSGGLEEWNDKILFPQISDKPNSQELKSIEKMKEISKFFGGSPQQNGGDQVKTSSVKTMPKLEMKSQIQPQKTGKKKKEGC